MIDKMYEPEHGISNIPTRPFIEDSSSNKKYKLSEKQVDGVKGKIYRWMASQDLRDRHKITRNGEDDE